MHLGLRLAAHYPDTFCSYLDDLERQEKLRDWQFRQAAEALGFLYSSRFKVKTTAFRRSDLSVVVSGR